MQETNPNLSPNDKAKKALQLFIAAQTPEEKDNWADVYEENREGYDPIRDQYATTIFLQELMRTDNNKLKQNLASEIHINMHDTYNKEAPQNAFFVNAVSIVLSTAKATADEETANYLYEQTIFILGEDDSFPLQSQDAEIVGHALLNSLNSKLKDQRKQARLLQQFNVISQENGHSLTIPETMLEIALNLLSEYRETSIEAITLNSSKVEKEKYFAYVQIEAELAKIASNNLNSIYYS